MTCSLRYRAPAWCRPGDCEDCVEAVEERAAIIAEACHVPQDEGLSRAKALVLERLDRASTLVPVYRG